MEPKELTIWALNQMVQASLAAEAHEDARVLARVLEAILVDPGTLFYDIERKEGE